MKRILLYLAMLAAGLFGPCAQVAHAQQCINPMTFSSSNITASGSTQLIAAPGLDANSGRALAIHICTVTVQVIQPGTPVNFSLLSGTGSVCATGPSIFAFVLGFGTAQSYTPPANWPIPLAGNTALCVNFSAMPTGATLNVLYSIY